MGVRLIQGAMCQIPNLMEIMIHDEEMKVSILLKSGPFSGGYTVDEVRNNLRRHGIVVELQEDMIRKIISDGLYDHYYTVAYGVPPTEGVEGYYEFFFDTNAQTGIPKILEDGSVDYSQIIELVDEGDVVATYHPAVMGVDGYKVTGELIRVVKRKEKSPLRLSGVKKEENNYIALFDGRITIRNNYLEVSPSLRIKGDLNHAYGNVLFSGDVFVEGDVRSGLSIDAGGCVIVDGTVEGAYIKATGDVIIGCGIQGDAKAVLEVNGDLVCNYIDSAKVNVHGRISTNSIVNSDVFSDMNIVVATENKGIIMGGVVCGMLGIKVNMVGHKMGIHTELYAGASKEDTEIIRRLRRSNRSFLNYERKIRVEEKGLLKELSKTEGTLRGEQIKKKLQLIKEEEEHLEKELDKNNQQLDELLNRISYANKANIIVNYQIYENVEIIVGTVSAEIPEDIEGARFEREGARVEVNPFVKARKQKDYQQRKKQIEEFADDNVKKGRSRRWITQIKNN